MHNELPDLLAKSQDSGSTRDVIETEERIFTSSQHPVLHHVCLFVKDIEAAIKFYTAGLGLKVVKEFDDIIGHRGNRNFPFRVPSVFIAAGEGRFIELQPAGDGVMSPPGFPLNHLAIAVSDIDASYQQALTCGGNAFGFELASEYWDGTPLDVTMSGDNSEQMRMAFIQGPGGELVELYQAAA